MILHSEHARRGLLSRSNNNLRGPQCEERAGFNPLRLGTSPPPRRSITNQRKTGSSLIPKPDTLRTIRQERAKTVISQGFPAQQGDSTWLLVLPHLASTSSRPSPTLLQVGAGDYNPASPSHAPSSKIAPTSVRQPPSLVPQHQVNDPTAPKV